MTGHVRRRPATLRIGELTVQVFAPGLKVIRRGKDGQQLYWVADEDAVKRGYPTKTRRIFVDLEREEAIPEIEKFCNSEQTAMIAWLDDAAAFEEPKLRFDGTVGSLIDLYETDPDSAFQDVKENTATSYGDWLRIVRATVGARRIDRIVPKDFRRWYKAWRRAETEDGPERVRRAYGCIQMLRVVLGYGIEAGIQRCVMLRAGLDKMRFERNPPRDKVMTFEQAKAIVLEAVRRDERGVALAQALQYECFLRQVDVIGQWRKKRATKPGPGQVRYGDRVWLGLTWDQIRLDVDLVIRTSKTGQPVVHVLADCPLVVLCLNTFDQLPTAGPVVARRDGLPWVDRRSFARRWRDIATAAGVPKDVHNRDGRASGISEAAEAGATDDDLARTAAHSDKAMTRRVYKRLGRESATRIQTSRVNHRRAREGDDSS